MSCCTNPLMCHYLSFCLFPAFKLFHNLKITVLSIRKGALGIGPKGVLYANHVLLNLVRLSRNLHWHISAQIKKYNLFNPREEEDFRPSIWRSYFQDANANRASFRHKRLCTKKKYV